MKNIFKEIDELPSEKIEEYSFGKFCYVFIGKDPIFVKRLLPLIQTSLADESFQADVMRVYTKGCMNERASILKKVEARCNSPDAFRFYTPLLDSVDKKLAINTILKLMDYLNNYLNEYPWSCRK